VGASQVIRKHSLPRKLGLAHMRHFGLIVLP